MINKSYKFESQENMSLAPELRDYCLCDVPPTNVPNVSVLTVPSSVMLVPYFQNSIADYQRVRFKFTYDSKT